MWVSKACRVCGCRRVEVCGCWKLVGCVSKAVCVCRRLFVGVKGLRAWEAEGL